MRHAGYSVLDIPRGLATLLLGLAFVLAALGVVLLVSGAAVLLGLPGVLAGFLAYVPRLASLIRLLGRPGRADRGDKQRRR